MALYNFIYNWDQQADFMITVERLKFHLIY